MPSKNNSTESPIKEIVEISITRALLSKNRDQF